MIRDFFFDKNHCSVGDGHRKIPHEEGGKYNLALAVDLLNVDGDDVLQKKLDLGLAGIGMNILQEKLALGLAGIGKSILQTKLPLGLAGIGENIRQEKLPLGLSMFDRIHGPWDKHYAGLASTGRRNSQNVQNIQDDACILRELADVREGYDRTNDKGVHVVAAPERVSDQLARQRKPGHGFPSIASFEM